MKNVRTDHKHETCEKKTGRQTAVTSCHFRLLSSILPSCTHVSDTFIIYHHKRVLAEGMAARWQCVTCQDNCKNQDEQKILTGLADFEPAAALLAATSTRSPPASHNTHTLDRYAVLLYTAAANPTAIPKGMVPKERVHMACHNSHSEQVHRTTTRS